MPLSKFFLWYCLMSILDLGLTNIWLGIHGSAGEMNPLPATFYSLYGFWGLLGLKLIIIPVLFLAVAAINNKDIRNAFMVFGGITITYAVYSNISILYEWVMTYSSQV